MSERQPPDDMPTRRRPDVVVRLPPTERVPRPPGAAGRGPDAEREQPTRRSETLRGRLPPPATDPASSTLYVPWWAFAVVILVVAGITCGLWWFVLASRGDASTTLGPTPTPIFVIITATPTLGPASNAQPEQTPTQTPTEVAPPPVMPTVPPPQIAIGGEVVITGTEGDGLAIRQGPGLSYSYFFVGFDGDQFIVQDGPREADGYTWWYISDPTNPDRSGWAASAFLQPVSP